MVAQVWINFFRSTENLILNLKFLILGSKSLRQFKNTVNIVNIVKFMFLLSFQNIVDRLGFYISEFQ